MFRVPEYRLSKQEESIVEALGHLPDYSGLLGWGMSLEDLGRLIGVGKDSTIAVVGSSGRLLGSGLGAEVDAHTTVIRMNGAPGGQGYERSVGKRTPVRVAWEAGLGEAFERNAVDDSQFVILWSPSTEDKRALMRTARRTEDEIACIPAVWGQEKMWKNTMDRKGLRPSTGIIALALAIGLARAVGAQPPNAYGFGACAGCNRYYDCDGSNSTKGSNNEAERNAKDSGVFVLDAFDCVGCCQRAPLDGCAFRYPFHGFIGEWPHERT